MEDKNKYIIGCRVEGTKVYGEKHHYNIKVKKYIIVNKWDRMLQPVFVMLPKPPSFELIDGVYLPRDKQIFHKVEYPPKLKKLEDRVMSVFKTMYKQEKTFSTQRFMAAVWDELLANSRTYADEIQWIKKQHYHIRNGYWCVIDEEATYIPGWMYFYLNFWKIDDVETVEYREGDRENFILSEYLYKTDHDAFYESVGRRTFFGIAQPKHRRDGATHKALCIGHCILHYDDYSNINGGIQSFDGTSAEKIYQEKYLTAFEKMHFFLRMQWDGGEKPKGGISFNCHGYLLPRESAGSTLKFASSTKRQFFDSGKLHFYLGDESGKTKNEDIYKGYFVIKPIMSTAKGTNIFGFSIHPSTVADMDSGGGKQYLSLLEQSNFYNRNTINQTVTGLMTYFDSCITRLEGYIDIFGKGIMDDPTEEDLWRIPKPMRDNEGKLLGARRFIMQTRRELKDSGKASDIEALVQDTKLHPIEYLDCFGGLSGGIGFDTMVLKDKKDQIIKQKLEGEYPVRNYTLMWEIDDKRYTAEEFIESGLHTIPGSTDRGNVIAVPNEIGRFKVLEFPPLQYQNKRIKKDGIWTPMYPLRHTSCSDPFRFFKAREQTDQMLIKKSEVKAGTSDGAFTILRERDYTIDPNGCEAKGMKTNRFIVAYRDRPEIDVFAEECLMADILWGCMHFPEVNITDVYEHYTKRGFSGYLLYDIDLEGKVKAKPGFSSLQGSKNDLFTALKSHIKYYGVNEQIDEIISEWGDISKIEEMTHYDLVTTTGGCLLGSNSQHREYFKTDNNVDPVEDRPEFFTYHSY